MTWSIESAWAHVVEIIRRAEPLGLLTTASGARAVGHVPNIAPLAYLHTIYPPLGQDGLEAVEREVRRPLPEEYRQLLMRTNGLDLFMSSLCVYGLRASYSRASAERLPFSGELANTLERPPGVPDRAVVVGLYGQDGSQVFMDAHGAARCDRDSGAILNRWASLADWLVSEATRMEAVHVLPTQPAGPVWQCAVPPEPDVR